jgi:hypothetical protein
LSGPGGHLAHPGVCGGRAGGSLSAAACSAQAGATGGASGCALSSLSESAKMRPAAGDGAADSRRLAPDGGVVAVLSGMLILASVKAVARAPDGAACPPRKP